MVTPTDILEAIVGDMADNDDKNLDPKPKPDGSLIVDAAIDVRRFRRRLGIDLGDNAGRYATLAGYLYSKMGKLPQPSQKISVGEFCFEILEMDGRRIQMVRVTKERKAPLK